MALTDAELSSSQIPPKARLWLGIVLALVILTFASTFTFGWVYDDPPYIPGNVNLRWDRLGFLFTHHLWAGIPGMTTARFYRPLLPFCFLVLKTLFGLNPHWFHVFSVLAHVVATALAFFIVRRWLGNYAAALLAAAVYGLHPLQAESVSWITSADDSLAAVFCFTSFLALQKARDTRQRTVLCWALSVISFVLALLVKEVSVVLPAILLVDVWVDSQSLFTRGSKFRLTATIVALFGGIAAAWLAWRHHVLGQMATTRVSIGWGASLLTAPKIVLFQFFRVLVPIRLSPHYDFKLVAPGRIPGAWLPLLGLLVLLFIMVFVAKKSPQLWVAYAWLLLPLVPSLNPRWLNEDDFVHDRYMCLSMLGVALLAGSGYAAARRRWPGAGLLSGLAIVLVVILAFATVIQSQYWANDVYLFSRAVEIAPNSEWAQLNYGAALSSRGRYAEAIPHFVRSYDLKASWNAADYAAFAYQNSGDLLQAERWFVLALQQNPSLPDAWFGLGRIRLAQQRPADAVVLFQKALALSPEADGYHYALGSALEQLAQKPAALVEYRTELRLHPYQTGARKAIERLSPSFATP